MVCSDDLKDEGRQRSKWPGLIGWKFNRAKDNRATDKRQSLSILIIGRILTVVKTENPSYFQYSSTKSVIVVVQFF